MPRLLGVENYLNNYLAYKHLHELPYTRGIRIASPLRVKIYFNDYYFTMYKCLTRSRIRVKLASPSYMGLAIIMPIYVCRAPVYAWNSHPRLLGVNNCLNNYFAYKRMTRFRTQS